MLLTKTEGNWRNAFGPSLLLSCFQCVRPTYPDRVTRVKNAIKTLSQPLCLCVCMCVFIEARPFIDLCAYGLNAAATVTKFSYLGRASQLRHPVIASKYFEIKRLGLRRGTRHFRQRPRHFPTGHGLCGKSRLSFPSVCRNRVAG